MTDGRAGTLEEKTAVAIEAVERLLANCRGYESDEWVDHYVAIRDALKDGRHWDALTHSGWWGSHPPGEKQWPITKWVGSGYMERRLYEVMCVLHRQFKYPHHVEPVEPLCEFPSQLFVERRLLDFCSNRGNRHTESSDFVAVAYLRVITGPLEGQFIALPSGRSLIGRNAACDIVVPSPQVRRNNSGILADNGRFWILDIHDSEFTKVNGIFIRRLTELKDGDIIQCGNQSFQVQEWQRAAPAFQFCLQPSHPHEAIDTPVVV